MKMLSFRSAYQYCGEIGLFTVYIAGSMEIVNLTMEK